MAKDYVTFYLDGEHCGLPIENVISIERDQEKTRIPNSLDFIDGVINLRGEVIAILDLRKRLGITDVLESKDNRIIVIKHEDVAVGLVVDSVSEVIEIDPKSIDNAPVSEENRNYEFIQGVAKTNEGLITILSLEKILEQ